MSAMLHPALSGADLLGLFAHFLVLSLLAIGGAITTAPDMHRYVVDEQADGQGREPGLEGAHEARVALTLVATR